MVPNNVLKSLANCGSSYVIITKEEEQGKSVLKIPIRCRSWSCPRCSRKKSRQFAGATFAHFEGSKHVTVMTLTLSGGFSKPDTFKHIASSWNRLRTLMVKTFGKFKYVKVLEFHKSGKPHYHILLNRFIPQRWLSARAARAGFGRICDIRHIDDRGGFYYVLKYLRKFNPDHPGVFEFYSSKSRLISGSSGFSIATPSSGCYKMFLRSGDAYFVDIMMDALKRAFEMMSYKCLKTSVKDDSMKLFFIYTDPGGGTDLEPELEFIHRLANDLDWQPENCSRVA